MSADAQLTEIHTKQFYTDLQTKAGEILAAFQTAGFTVTGESWVQTSVGKAPVPVWFQIRDTDLFFRVGQNEDQTYIYEWRAPKEWVM